MASSASMPATCPHCGEQVLSGQNAVGEGASRSHELCVRRFAAAWERGCATCDLPFTEEQLEQRQVVGDRYGPPITLKHRACFDADTDEDVNAGLNANVREGNMERRWDEEKGEWMYRLTQKGEQEVAALLKRARS